VRGHSEREYEVDVAASTSLTWPLVARPDRWHRWAPHVRGAWGLGTPEVREGARGAARLVGVVPVPARILSVERGRAWTWQVGPVRLAHVVVPLDEDDSACRLTFRLAGPTPLVAAYGPVVHALMLNLARVAEAADR
jgi:hypothetical protein